MKITASKSDLVRALSHVAPVADRKGTMPVLANIKLTASGDSLGLVASRLTITATASAEATVDDEGSICLPAAELFERVRAMPDGAITIDCKGTAATIKAKGAARRFTLHGIPADEFPKVPELAGSEWSQEITATRLLELLTTAMPAVSHDESRPHLNSMLLEPLNGGLRCVATDGHRLHLLALSESPESTGAAMLLPLAAAGRLKNLADGADGAVLLRRSGSSLWATVDGQSICCSLTDAQFPPYQQVVPASSAGVVTIDRTALSIAVKAVAIAASVSQGGVSVKVDKSKLLLSAESPDGGEASDSVECETSGKFSDSYGVGARYLLEALASLASDSVEIKLSGELDPILISSAGGSGDRLAVVMPMRLT